MTAQHTPGPWEARCRDVSYQGGEWPADNFLQWEVFGPEEPSGRGSFHQADALLIAAAPDLLEALRLFVGAAYPVAREIDPRGHTWSEAYLEQALSNARAAIQKATHKEQT